MNEYVFRKEGFSSSREELLLNETLFHNANGYLGVRSNFEEGYDGPSFDPRRVCQRLL